MCCVKKVSNPNFYFYFGNDFLDPTKGSSRVDLALSDQPESDPTQIALTHARFAKNWAGFL